MDQSIWRNVLGQIELTVPKATYSTWFKQTSLLSIDDESAVISVPNIFAKSQFEARYTDRIREALADNGVNPAAISYEIVGSKKKSPISRETPPLAKTTSNRQTNKPTPATTLNPKYTFDSFVVGSSNDLAYTASQTVAKYPGDKYNPLFLYGGVGLGKTHLIQAIGNQIEKSNPEKVVRYISSEGFSKDFIESIRYKKKGFADKYRNVDVLIVDDMQFIANKEKTQEEFFHTFNALHQANKQIIISSDKPPRSIPTLTERLRSRFEWGMAIDIQLPDFETRCAIIESKCASLNTSLDHNVIEYIASNVKTNIRELEGVLNQILAMAELRGDIPDITMAESFMKNTKQTRPHYLTVKQVIDRTAKYFQISSDEICSAKRDKHIVTPRQIAMYLLRSELHLSFPKIARELGRKDHTTAIHSIDKIEKAIKFDVGIREQVSEIREMLYA